MLTTLKAGAYLHHIHLKSPDPERLAAFYGDALDMDVEGQGNHTFACSGPGRRLVISECWNTFGDLGAATRSSERKVKDAEEQAVAIAGDGPPFEVGLCWIVRDTKANRALVARYEHIFEAKFPGSSAQWLRALTEPGAPLPKQPGLVWSDVNATRLIARRRTR